MSDQPQKGDVNETDAEVGEAIPGQDGLLMFLAAGASTQKTNAPDCIRVTHADVHSGQPMFSRLVSDI